jgi:hypothetical protein
MSGRRERHRQNQNHCKQSQTKSFHLTLPVLPQPDVSKRPDFFAQHPGFKPSCLEPAYIY